MCSAQTDPSPAGQGQPCHDPHSAEEKTEARRSITTSPQSQLRQPTNAAPRVLLQCDRMQTRKNDPDGGGTGSDPALPPNLLLCSTGPQGDIWQRVETFWVVTAAGSGRQLALGGREPATLPIVLAVNGTASGSTG